MPIDRKTTVSWLSVIMPRKSRGPALLLYTYVQTSMGDVSFRSNFFRYQM
jgi:hypothetical protein